MAAALVVALPVAVGGCATSAPRSGRPPARTVGWPSFGNTASGTRYSDLRQVDTRNVASLQVAWHRAEGDGLSTWESFPIVDGHTMYVTSGTDQVEALNAATGRLLWSYTPLVNFFVPGAGPLVVPTNRGVAVWDRRVYLTTLDDRLIALSAASGRQLWQTQVASPSAGYVETAAPTAASGVVYVGNSSGAESVRGFVAAFSARTGRLLWRTYTVPPAGHGWVARAGNHGGGDVWMPPTADPAAGTVYVATGNPTPALIPAIRPGCDAHSDSTLALAIATGKLRWARQAICGDAWDYDTDEPPITFRLDIGGRLTPVVGDGSKAGVYTVRLAATGRVVSRSRYLTPYTQPHRVPTRLGVDLCPGAFGGLEYSPPAFDPLTGAVYVQGVRACMRYTALRPGPAADRTVIGGTYTLLRTPPPAGSVVALQAQTGRILWSVPLPRPAVGGTLATAGGLVFAGDDDGRLYGFDARTGRILWSERIGLPFGSGPITYAVNGIQYLAIVAGGSQLALLEGIRTGGELVVYRLPRRAGDPGRLHAKV